MTFDEYRRLRERQHNEQYDALVKELFPEEAVVHDFDPSGDEHPEACMCPCCDQAEGKLD